MIRWICITLFNWSIICDGYFVCSLLSITLIDSSMVLFLLSFLVSSFFHPLLSLWFCAHLTSYPLTVFHLSFSVCFGLETINYQSLSSISFGLEAIEFLSFFVFFTPSPDPSLASLRSSHFPLAPPALTPRGVSTPAPPAALMHMLFWCCCLMWALASFT